MEFHRLDDKHIEVLAGDLARGFWKFSSDQISRDGEAPIKLDKSTKSLELRMKRQVSKMDTISDLPVGNIVGMALGNVLGPLGGLASSAVGFAVGKSDFMCIGCQLTDGRKFIAWMSKSVLENWEKSSNVKAKEKEGKKEKNPWEFWH